MIPKVKAWGVRIVETNEAILVLAPTKLLARLNFRFEHPEHWGKEIKISPARIELV